MNTMNKIFFGTTKLYNNFYLFCFIYIDLLQGKKYHMPNLHYHKHNVLELFSFYLRTRAHFIRKVAITNRQVKEHLA
jgi:hypothetical protein